MKKLLILAAAAATLSLGACNRSSCPAYGNHAGVYKSSPITASTAAPATRL